MIGVAAVIPLAAPEAGGVALDKVFHLCEYLLFAWLLVRAGHASGFARVNVLAVAFLLSFSYGLILEGVQTMLPYRQGEWGDVAANALGSLMGMIIGWSRL